MSNTSQHQKRQAMAAQLRIQTNELVKKIRLQLQGSEDSESGVELEDRLLRGWAAWQVAVLQGEALGAKSFGMIALGSIFECVRAIEERDLSLGDI